MVSPAASVRGLTVAFPGLPTVADVDLDLSPGTVTALVGESGAGKSVTLAAMLGLLPRSAAVSGRLSLAAHGTSHPAVDLDLADRERLAHEVRGSRIALVPQSPSTWLTPVRTLRSQLVEAAAAARRPAGRTAAWRPSGGDAAAREAAARAGFGWELARRYPHEVSGGQLQRAALALALVGGAGVLVTDEPTTGLDPELAAQALQQLRREADGGAAVLVVTHDLVSAQSVADDILVMYAGRVVERAPAPPFFAGPVHPYSAGLLDALPERAFRAIEGDPPAPGEVPAGCAFRVRCPRASGLCLRRPPLPAGRAAAACHHPLVNAT